MTETRSTPDANRVKYSKDVKNTFGLKDWINIPHVDDIKANINSANDINKPYLDRIEEGLKVLKAELPEDFKKKLKQNQSKTNPKIAKQQAEWAYGKLTEPFHIANNIFKIDATNPMTSAYARQCERILNFQFTNNLPKRYLIDQSAKSFYDNGVVIGKVHWDSETITETVTTTEVITLEDGTLDAVKNSTEESYLIENKPSVVICDYDSVTIDPSCRGDIDRAMFISHKYKTNKANLIKDGRYKNIDKIVIKDEPSKVRGLEITGGISDSNNPLDNMDFNDENRKLFDVVEYWALYDIYDSGILEPILITFAGDVVIRAQLSPMPDGKLPFVAKSMLAELGTIYAEPVSLLIKEEQQTIGNIQRNVLDKISNSMKDQSIIHPNLFSSALEKQKFFAGRSATSSGQVNPATAIYKVETKDGVDKDLFAYLQSCKSEAQDITGNMPMTQSSGNKFNSSGALGAFVDTVAVRESMELGRFVEFWVEVSRKVLSMSLAWMEQEEIEYITGEAYVPYPDIPRTIQPYHLTTNVITMSERRDKSTFLMSILERMQNFSDPEFEGEILSKLSYINDMPDIASRIIEIVNRPPPEPSPAELRMMELELMDKEADVELKRSQSADFFANAQVKSARIEGESAKAEYTYARADELTQKVIDRETGKDLTRKYAESEIDLQREIQLDSAKQDKAFTNTYLQNLMNTRPKSLDPRNN